MYTARHNLGISDNFIAFLMSYLFVIYGFNLWNNVRPIRLITLSTIIVLASDIADDPRGVIFLEKSPHSRHA